MSIPRTAVTVLVLMSTVATGGLAACGGDEAAEEAATTTSTSSPATTGGDSGSDTTVATAGSEFCDLVETEPVEALLGGPAANVQATAETCTFTSGGGDGLKRVVVSLAAYPTAAEAARLVSGDTTPVPGLEVAAASAATIRGSDGDLQVAVGPGLLKVLAFGVEGLTAEQLVSVAKPVIADD